MTEEQKKVIQKEMDRLEHLGIIQKGLTSYSSPVVLVKHKNQNLYRVCSDFCICRASARPPASQSTAPHFPCSLDGIRNQKGSKRPHPSELINRTPPSKLDMAQFGT